MMEANKVMEVLEVLIGDLVPIGAPYHDEEVIKNLKNMTQVADYILTMMNEIKIDTEQSKEYSVQQCHLVVKEFLSRWNLIEG